MLPTGYFGIFEGLRGNGNGRPVCFPEYPVSSISQGVNIMHDLIAHRFHEFSYGHRVVGQGGKCEHLHGHNGTVTFHCVADSLDDVGRVIDFSCIKTSLCVWLEEHWDHRFLIWEKDLWKDALLALDDRVVVVPFNPTAENLADYLLNVVGPQVLPEGVKLARVDFQETNKCGASLVLPDYYGRSLSSVFNQLSAK